MRESHTPRSAVSRSRGMALLRDAPPNAKVGLVFEGDTADARGSRGVAVKHEAGIAFPTKRLKYLVSLRRSSNTRRDGARPYIGLENIESRTGRLVDGDAVSGAGTTSSADDESRSSGNGFESGDVLFGKLRPYLAKAWVAEFPGRCTTEALVMAPHSIDPRFLRAVCLSSTFIHAVNASTFGSKMPRAEWDSIADIRVPTPDRERQIVIADYLDRETARLDALVAAKERFLKLLAEKRKALITRAVTRGLDPDAPTQDSGISWMGEIPEYWEIRKLGHIASIGNGSTPNRNNAAYWKGGRIPWLNSSVVNQYEVSAAEQFVTAHAVQECHLPLAKAGSVLIAITGQGRTRGRAVVLSIDSTINQHLAFIQPERSRLRPWFLRWTLAAAYDFLRNISDDIGGTKGALTCEQVANLRVPVPPPEEQAAILDHIAASTGRIDFLRSKTEKAIAIIKERRAALVTAAVAGRIDAGSTP